MRGKEEGGGRGEERGDYTWWMVRKGEGYIRMPDEKKRGELSGGFRLDRGSIRNRLIQF